VTAEARRRAERCFAVARSTTFAGERNNAVSRGIAIAEEAGLDLNSFDIPGRVKAPPKRPTMADFFDSRSDTEAVLRSFEEAIRRKMRGGQSRSEDSYADAFAAGVQREQARREADPNRSGAAMSRLRADLAINWLWTAGIRVYGAATASDGSRRFAIPSESDLEYDEEGVIEIANRFGWAGGATFKDGEPQPDLRTASGSSGPGAKATADNISQMKGRSTISAELLGRAIVYLTSRGHSISSIPDTDFWQFDDDIIQSQTLVFVAKMRGFRP
jgi:hypothetical protein